MTTLQYLALPLIATGVALWLIEPATRLMIGRG